MMCGLRYLKTLLLISATNAFITSTGSNDITHLQKQLYTNPGSALYPQATETRDLKTLDGIWNFRKSPSADPEIGYREKWYRWDLAESGEVIPMPVPASYNDVGEDRSLRDHVGLVWYDRRFHVPSWWKTSNQRVWLRFSSVHYAAQVWVNGISQTYHEFGHLPFEVDVTEAVRGNSSHLLTVAVDNMLLGDTVPQGRVSYEKFLGKTKVMQSYTFDFFNYAGIHRSVFLYSTPQVYIEDVIVNTDIQGLTGFVVYNVTFKGAPASEVSCLVQLQLQNGSQVAALQDCAGLLEVANANFWWPYLMHAEPGYLYNMKVSLLGLSGELLDTYTQKIGIRTVTWTSQSMFINHKPIYFRGFGMHEDSDMRGKGWDPVLWVKNFNLIKWMGGNVFRTSHYPYAEEIYQLADELGIMIIDECPSVDTDLFTDVLLTKHKQSLTELIRRDKNHPSVVMWSVSNEPRTQDPLADNYFRDIVKHVKSMDLSRPVSLAMAQPIDRDKAAKHLDIIMFNRYNSWYSSTGQLDKIVPGVVNEARGWFNRYNKPVLMSEYGADTIAGMHIMPEYVWSEEYQVSCLAEHFKAFDQLRGLGFFIGEFVWNFADFNTAQTTTRAGGNKKGIFTRSRQPKAAAHHMRVRYHQLATADYKSPSPKDLTYYTSDRKPLIYDEL